MSPDDPTMSRPRLLDLFCGSGWAEGLREIGLREVGIDLDPAVCATRRAAGFQTIRADVATYPTGHLRGKVAGLIASPPCQSFSQAGKGLGIRDLPLIYAIVDEARRTGHLVDPAEHAWQDQRSPLVLEPLRFVLGCRPGWVALEQAPPVLPLWCRYALLLSTLGYQVWAGRLCAADYGVPQTRVRAILMASLHGPVAPPEPSHCDQRRGGCMEGHRPWVSMAQALGWGWDGPSRTVCGHREPRWTYEAGGSTGRVLATGSGNGDAHDYQRDAERPAPAVTSRGDRWCLRARTQAHAATRDLDQPAPTIVPGGRCNDISWVLETNRDQREDGTRQTRPADEPVPSITGKSGGQWVVRTGANSERAGGVLERYERGIDEPAPVVDTKAGGTWTLHTGNHDRAYDRSVPRPLSEPAPTIVVGHTLAQWAWERPATTVEELAVLQGFPPDYPFQGNKTERSQQIGNAVCPPFAAAIIGELLGLDWRKAVAAT